MQNRNVHNENGECSHFNIRHSPFNSTFIKIAKNDTISSKCYIKPVFTPAPDFFLLLMSSSKAPTDAKECKELATYQTPHKKRTTPHT